MSMLGIRPLLHKATKKSFLIRVLACTLVIIFAVFVGYIAGRMSPNECGKSVLGSQWPTFPSPTPTPQVNHWPTFPTATPTPQVNHWPTFPSPTPTPQPNQWPHPATPTPTPQVNQWPTFPSPTPTTQPNQWPTPTPTNAPLAPNKIKQIVNNLGIIPAASGITMNTGTHDYTVKGNVSNKILGLIQVSTPITVTINGNGVIKESTAKPWWQKILTFTNPFAGLPSAVNCSSITDGFACINHPECNFWQACGKCVTSGTPYDPECFCSPNKSKGTCQSWACSNGPCCQWYPECAGGGTCAVTGTSSKVACGGCGNVIGVDACNKQGSGCWIDSNCGRCEESAYSDPSCTCSSVKTKSGCDGASNCKWHPECAGGGVCAPWFDSTDTYVNSKVACGGCANINGKSECTNAGCIYSNNQCQ